MCSKLALFVSVFLAAVVVVVSSNGERLSCRQVNQIYGSTVLDCVKVRAARPRLLSVLKRYILGLKSNLARGHQSIEIDVPNYNYETEYMSQAPAKGWQSQSYTSSNVNSRPPQVSYGPQKEERYIPQKIEPVVQRIHHTFDVKLYGSLVGKAVQVADNAARPGESWSNRIRELLDLMDRTFKSIGSIAVKDNLEIGTRIVNTLNEEFRRANRIFDDYTSFTSGGRFKRQGGDPGMKAHEDVARVGVDAANKIEADKAQLSPGAQSGITDEQKNYLKKCTANACKDGLIDYEKAEAGKRQKVG